MKTKSKGKLVQAILLVIWGVCALVLACAGQPLPLWTAPTSDNEDYDLD